MKAKGKTLELSAVDVKLLDEALYTYIKVLYKNQQRTGHEQARMKLRHIMNHAICIRQVIKTVKTEEQNEKEMERDDSY
jgi:hypothetical protein